MTLKVKVQKIVEMGTELWEDAYTYHAIHEYVNFVGDVPEWAWGELPWSETWKANWATALDYRLQEAKTTRDKTGEHAGLLFQAAADYSNTDIENAYEIDLQTKDGGSGNLKSFLSQDGMNSGKIPEFEPGGKAHKPDYPSGYSSTFVTTNADMLAIQQEIPQPMRQDCEEHLSPYDLQHGLENDNLDAFCSDYGDFLYCIETQVGSLGLGSNSNAPFSDLIMPAWKARPSVIGNRANMLASAGETYDQMASEMKQEAETLAGRIGGYWDSQAAQAWKLYADAVVSYLGAVRDEVNALSEHGKNAKSVIQGMRNQYAKLGNSKISNLIDLAKEAATAAADAASTNSSPWQSVADGLNDFFQALLNEQDKRLDESNAIIDIAEQARKEDDRYTTQMHSVTPYPDNQVEDGGWHDGDTW